MHMVFNRTSMWVCCVGLDFFGESDNRAMRFINIQVHLHLPN